MPNNRNDSGRRPGPSRYPDGVATGIVGAIYKFTRSATRGLCEVARCDDAGTCGLAHRALDVYLSILAHEADTGRLPHITYLSHDLCLPRSSMHRLLHKLEDKNLVVLKRAGPHTLVDATRAGREALFKAVDRKIDTVSAILGG